MGNNKEEDSWSMSCLVLLTDHSMCSPLIFAFFFFLEVGKGSEVIFFLGEAASDVIYWDMECDSIQTLITK